MIGHVSEAVSISWDRLAMLVQRHFEQSASMRRPSLAAVFGLRRYLFGALPCSLRRPPERGFPQLQAGVPQAHRAARNAIPQRYMYLRDLQWHEFARNRSRAIYNAKRGSRFTRTRARPRKPQGFSKKQMLSQTTSH